MHEQFFLAWFYKMKAFAKNFGTFHTRWGLGRTISVTAEGVAASLGCIDGFVAVLGIEALFKAFFRNGALELSNVALNELLLNVLLSLLHLRVRDSHVPSIDMECAVILAIYTCEICLACATSDDPFSKPSAAPPNQDSSPIFGGLQQSKSENGRRFDSDPDSYE